MLILIIVLSIILSYSAVYVFELFSNPTYVLDPVEPHSEWTSKPNPSWYGCRDASCMGDDEDGTRAWLYSGNSVPYQTGYLLYNVPSSSDTYTGSPLSVTVYARVADLVAENQSYVMLLLNDVSSGPIRVVWDNGAFNNYQYSFNVEGWSFDDIDDMMIGVYLIPGEIDALTMGVSKIWCVVEYDDTSQPPEEPDVGITYTYTIVTTPGMCNIYIDEVYVGQTDATGILVLDNVLSGSHVLKISKDGYFPSEKNIYVNDDAVISISLTVSYIIIYLLILILIISLVVIYILTKYKK